MNPQEGPGAVECEGRLSLVMIVKNALKRAKNLRQLEIEK